MSPYKANINLFSHSWMASGADHIVILILLLSMIVWFWFFGDRDELASHLAMVNKQSLFNTSGEFNIRINIKYE